mgnify:CR=1 FL=1
MTRHLCRFVLLLSLLLAQRVLAQDSQLTRQLKPDASAIEKPNGYILRFNGKLINKLATSSATRSLGTHRASRLSGGQMMNWKRREELKILNKLRVVAYPAATLGADTLYSVPSSSLSMPQLMSVIKRKVPKATIGVIPNSKVKLFSDPYFKDQWALENRDQQFEVTDGAFKIIGAKPGEDLGLTRIPSPEVGVEGGGCYVAVLDSGVNEVSDLERQLLTLPPNIPYRNTSDDIDWNSVCPAGEKGCNFFKSDRPGASTEDRFGHGTFVAGLLSAKKDNTGILGIAPGATIIPARVVGDDGSGDFIAILNAVSWVVALKEAGYNICALNLSVGTNVIPQKEALFLFREIFQRAVDSGIFVSIAAGNDAENPTREIRGRLSFPALLNFSHLLSSGEVLRRVDGLIAVTSMAASGLKSSFAQWQGNGTTIGAPGEFVLGPSHTRNPPDLNEQLYISDQSGNYYSYRDGTSFAAPYIAGIATILKSKYPCLRPVDIGEILRESGKSRSDVTDRGETISTIMARVDSALEKARAFVCEGPKSFAISVVVRTPDGLTVQGIPVTEEISGQTYNTNLVGTSQFQITEGQSYRIVSGRKENIFTPSVVEGIASDDMGTINITVTSIAPPPPQTTNLIGKVVVTTTMAGISGAKVTATGELALADVISSGDGSFSFANVQIGKSYTLRASAEGYSCPNSFPVTVGQVGIVLIDCQAIPSVNRPPVFSAIEDKTMTSGSTLKVILDGSDPDGDVLSYSATLSGLPATNPGYEVMVKYNIGFAGGYYQNFLGLGEKWLVSKDYRWWYAILPNGEFRRLGNGTATDVLRPENLLAKLSPEYWKDPELIWNASPTPGVTLVLNGNTLEITSANYYSGEFTVDLTVSDAKSSAQASFNVRVVPKSD